jgi:hypothetical protein
MYADITRRKWSNNQQSDAKTHSLGWSRWIGKANGRSKMRIGRRTGPTPIHIRRLDRAGKTLKITNEKWFHHMKKKVTGGSQTKTLSVPGWHVLWYRLFTASKLRGQSSAKSEVISTLHPKDETNDFV